jgi:hypothetical protein
VLPLEGALRRCCGSHAQAITPHSLEINRAQFFSPRRTKPVPHPILPDLSGRYPGLGH